MRICRVSPHFQDRFLYAEHYVARALQRRGVETSVLTSDKVDRLLKDLVPAKSEAVSRSESITVYRLPSVMPGGKVLFSPSRLRHFVRERRFDCFHLHGLGNPACLQFMETLKGAGIDAPVVVSDHSTDATSLGNRFLVRHYHEATRRWLARHADRISRVVVVTEPSSALLGQRFQLPPNLFEFIPLGFDESIFNYQRVEPPAAETLRVGLAGKIDERKRVDQLIEAIGELGDSLGPVECLVAGLTEAPHALRQSLLDLARARGVQLTALPLLQPPDLATFYRSLNVATFPGSISITTLEASGVGTPVILYRSIPGLEDRVSGDKGQLFDTLEELVAILRDRLATRESAETRAARAALAAREFSWQVLAERYLDVYQQAISG